MPQLSPNGHPGRDKCRRCQLVTMMPAGRDDAGQVLFAGRGLFGDGKGWWAAHLIQIPQWFPMAFRIQSNFSATCKSAPGSTCLASLPFSHDLQLLLDALVQQNPTTFLFLGALRPHKPTAFASCVGLFLPGAPFPCTTRVANSKIPFLMLPPALHSFPNPSQGGSPFLVFCCPWCFLQAWHPPPFSLLISLLSFFFSLFYSFFLSTLFH